MVVGVSTEAFHGLIPPYPVFRERQGDEIWAEIEVVIARHFRDVLINRIVSAPRGGEGQPALLPRPASEFRRAVYEGFEAALAANSVTPVPPEALTIDRFANARMNRRIADLIDGFVINSLEAKGHSEYEWYTDSLIARADHASSSVEFLNFDESGCYLPALIRAEKIGVNIRVLLSAEREFELLTLPGRVHFNPEDRIFAICGELTTVTATYNESDLVIDSATSSEAVFRQSFNAERFYQDFQIAISALRMAEMIPGWAVSRTRVVGIRDLPHNEYLSDDLATIIWDKGGYRCLVGIDDQTLNELVSSRDIFQGACRAAAAVVATTIAVTRGEDKGQMDGLGHLVDSVTKMLATMSADGLLDPEHVQRIKTVLTETNPSATIH